MIYLLLSALSAALGLLSCLGPTTLLRPVMDAVSPLSPASIAILCTIASLSASLVAAFFAIGQPLPLHPDELLLLAVGGALGGVLGDLASARFLGMIPPRGALLLQNGLLFTIIALPALYFGTLSRSIRPLAMARVFSFPVSILLGTTAAFLSYGAEPLTLMLYFLLFDAENDEAAAAALTVALFSMAGKLITLLIRTKLHLPDADVLLFILPGAILGALLAMIPGMQRLQRFDIGLLLRLSLFAALINIAKAIA